MSLFNTPRKENNDQWMSISDMMSVMMFIFMIIAVVYARTFEAEPAEKCDALLKKIDQEFKGNFKEWQVTLEKDLTVRFENPKVLFEVDAITIRPKFKDILQDFWPRYIKLLKTYDKNEKQNTKNGEGDIKEIRIEGHTSKKYGNLSLEKAYLENMKLSQGRTRSILEYVFSLESDAENKKWMRKYITANGLSSSQPMLNENGRYSSQLSRRVEFRSISKACLKSGKQQ